MSKASSDQSLSLSAAGRHFQLGMVYDAYTHQLLESLNLLEKCPNVGKKSRLCPSLSLDLKSSYTINERMDAFRFDGHIKVRIGFKFLNLGSASASVRYIYDNSSSVGQARMTLQYKHLKRYEELDTETIHKLSGHQEVLKVAKERGATHFVAGMTYGNQVLIDFKFTKRNEKEHDLLDIQLKGAFRLGQALADTFNKDEKRATNFDDIQCDIFCDSMDIKQPASFEEAQNIYQNLPTTLQNVEAVDSVYLLPLSIIDKTARKFKMSDIDEVAMQKLVHIRDDLYEQEMQCKAMEKREMNTSQIKDDIQQYTEKLKCMLSSTCVKSWNEQIVKHNSSDFQMHKFQQRLKKELQLITARTCRKCRKELPTESELAQHMRDHEPRACRRCNNEFSTESELVHHMRIHEALICLVCKKEFSTESELEQHRRNKEVPPCYICKQEFSTQKEYTDHWYDHYVRTCSNCEKEFSTQDDLAQHKRDVEARTCRRCNNEFSTESECAQHMRDADARTCIKCKEEFSTESDFAQHMRDSGDYRCDKCDREFCTESLLAAHLTYFHARNCRRCNKEFSTEEELAQHERDVNAIPCCTCSEEFCTEEELVEHIRISHDDLFKVFTGITQCSIIWD